MLEAREGLLEQFLTITEVEDSGLSRNILAKNKWNLQISVDDYFQNHNHSTDVNDDDDQKDPSMEGSWILIDFLRFWTGESFLSYFVDFTEFVLHGFWGFLFVPVWEVVFGSNNTNNSSRQTSLATEEQEFLNRPTFFHTGSLPNTLRIATNQDKLLFIFLHKPSCSDSQLFKNEVLENPVILDFLNTNFICWMGDASIRRDQELIKALGVGFSGFPFIALYACELVKIQVFWSYRGFMNVENLLMNLSQQQERFMEKNKENLRQEQERYLRAQQDFEFEMLEAQQELENHQNQIIDTITNPLESNICTNIAEKEEEEIKNFDLWKEELLKILPREPEPSDPDGIKIHFRLPNGEQMTRCFHNFNKIGDVRNFIYTCELKTLENEPIEHFSLIIPFPPPKKKFENDAETLLEAFGKTKRIKLIVQEIC